MMVMVMMVCFSLLHAKQQIIFEQEKEVGKQTIRIHFGCVDCVSRFGRLKSTQPMIKFARTN